MDDRRPTTDDVQGPGHAVCRPPSAVVFDSAVTSDYFLLKADLAFDDLMVHLIEPKLSLPEERGGREAEDRDVHPTLSEPGN